MKVQSHDEGTKKAQDLARHDKKIKYTAVSFWTDFDIMIRVGTVWDGRRH